MKRSQLIKLIHIGKRDLGYDRDVYEQVLYSTVSKTSCADMNDDQLKQVLTVFKNNGFKIKSNNANRKKYSPKTRNKLGEKTLSDKIRATWIGMYKDGLIKNGSEEALNHWISRMTKNKQHPEGIKNVEWLTTQLAVRVLESLKKFSERAALGGEK